MVSLIPVLAIAALATMPAVADEFTEVLESGLAAYREGDVAGARDDLEYAMKLLSDMKAETLARLLPAAPAGWTKETAESGGAGVATGLFGGGTTAAATYRRGTDEFTLTLIANSPMVSGIAAMVSGLTSIGGAETRRIERTEFAVSDGEVQGVVADKVMVSAGGGTATVEEMVAVIETLDFKALADF